MKGPTKIQLFKGLSNVQRTNSETISGATGW